MATPVVSKKRKRSQEPEIPEVKDEATALTNDADAAEVAETETLKALAPQEALNVQKKIFHTMKEAGRAFKKARDFEVRKIMKRIKATKNVEDASKVERLEKELHRAKSLDVHPYAHSYVYKKLQTDKLFVENPDLLSAHAPPVTENSADEASIKNIVGRLASTAAVKTAMTMSLNAIHRAAGIEVPHKRVPSKTKQPKHPSKAKDSTAQSSKSQKPLPERSASPNDDHAMDALTLLKLIEKERQQSDEEEDSQVSNEEDPSPQSPPPQSKKPARLPALSTGYILPSHSDSDPDQEYASFAPLKKERKNRRGQRERQAIWLKKYGSAARHLHPELKQQNTAKSKDKASRKIQSGSMGEAGEASVAPVEAVAAPPPKVNDPHPSWVAKQKLREQQQAVMHSAKAKKIVFD